MSCPGAHATDTRPVGGCGKLKVNCLPNVGLTALAGKPLICKSALLTLVTGSLKTTVIATNSATTASSGGSMLARVGGVSSRAVDKPAISPKSLLAGSQLNPCTASTFVP